MDHSHSDWCEMVPHCGLDLHFSDNEWCWTYFHVFVSHLYVFFEKCLFRSFAHCLIGLFIFLVLSCMSCLNILEVNYLSVVSFAIIFSHSEGCLFTLLIVSFAVQNLLSLIRSHCYAQVAKSPKDHPGADIRCKSKRVFITKLKLGLPPLLTQQLRRGAPSFGLHCLYREYSGERVTKGVFRLKDYWLVTSLFHF